MPLLSTEVKMNVEQQVHDSSFDIFRLYNMINTLEVENFNLFRGNFILNSYIYILHFGVAHVFLIAEHLVNDAGVPFSLPVTVQTPSSSKIFAI